MAQVAIKESFPHLHPKTIPLLSAAIEERIRALDDETYIEYEFGEVMHKKMLQHFHSRRVIRPRGMLICGPSGAGKTTIVRGFHAKFPDIEKSDITIKPVVYIVCPFAPGARLFLRTLLEQFRPGVHSAGTTDALMIDLTKYLRDCQVRLIIVDDVHNLVDSGTHNKLIETLGLIRNISSRSGVPIIMTGIELVEQVFEYDAQLASRFRSYKVPIFADSID